MFDIQREVCADTETNGWFCCSVEAKEQSREVLNVWVNVCGSTSDSWAKVLT